MRRRILYGTFILFIITTDLPTVSFVTFLADRITVCTNTDPSFSASGPLPAVVDFRVVSNLSNDGGRRFIQRLCDLIRLCAVIKHGLDGDPFILRQMLFRAHFPLGLLFLFAQ